MLLYSPSAPGAGGRNRLPESLKYDVVKTAIQQAFIDAGGTLSHHHGVGTDHAPWMEQDLSPAGVDLMVGLLKSADPKRNLNPGTLIPEHREW